MFFFRQDLKYVHDQIDGAIVVHRKPLILPQKVTFLTGRNMNSRPCRLLLMIELNAYYIYKIVIFAMFVIALHSRAALYEDIEKPLPIIVYELWNVFTRYMPQSYDVNKHITTLLHIKRDKYTHAVEAPAVAVEVSY